MASGDGDVFREKPWSSQISSNLFFHRIEVREVDVRPGKEVEMLKRLALTEILQIVVCPGKDCVRL